MTNSETKEGANEEKNENKTEHVFEEIISGSEISDYGNENIPLFNICSETSKMNVKSPKIPLLYTIPIPKTIEDSVKQNKQLDFLHLETEEENSYADSHFDTDKRIKKLNSFIKNKFSIDSSALIDRNLIERVINDLSSDIPSCENFQSYQKSSSGKDLSTKADNVETETFENEYGKSYMDNDRAVDKMSKSFTIDPESEKIAREYSQQTLFQNMSFIDDTFDGSQPLFLSSQSQDVLNSETNMDSNKNLIHSSEDFLHSNSQELFSTQVFIQDKKTINMDIYSNEFVSIENSYSGILKNRICEKNNSFNNGEMILFKQSGNEISVVKNNLFIRNMKEDENADCSKVSSASDSILKAEKVNDSNENTLETLHKTDTKNYQNESLPASSTSLKVNVTNEQDMQLTYDYKNVLPIKDQEDESTESLSDRNSNSPSLLASNKGHQKKESENKYIEICNSKSENCPSVFDYVKNIKVVQGSFKKISITEKEREKTNHHEVSTVFTDCISKDTSHFNTDSNSIIRFDHNNYNYIKLWLLKSDSIQDGKVANNPKKIFKSKSTRCSNRFQVPWKNVNAEEENVNSERIQENLDTIEKSLKNNQQTSSRKLQQELPNIDRMNGTKEIEQQINITDIGICVNNTHSENHETDKIKLQNEFYFKNVAKTQSRTKNNLSMLHEESISDIRDRPEDDSSIEKYLQKISYNLLSSKVEKINAENSNLFSRNDNCISESNVSGKETEQQINLTDPRIYANNTHSENQEIDMIELPNELNTENVAEARNRKEIHLTELHEDKMPDIHNRMENNSSVEKRIRYNPGNLPYSEDKYAIAENPELFSGDDNCISKSNMSGKGASEPTLKTSEIEIVKGSAACKVNQNMRNIALSHISTENNEKFSTKVTSTVNFNQEENLTSKSNYFFSTKKMPGYKQKRKTRYSSVYTNNSHSDNYHKNLQEASKDKGKLEIEKERQSYSDNDIEILEEFSVHKIKVEGKRISNLNLKSSEPFTINKMSLRKRKRKIRYSSFYANNNHSDYCPESLHEVSKDGEIVEIEKECQPYSDNDIEILEEFVAHKIKVEGQTISNLNLKSSESFATNKMSLRKRKRKIRYSSFYANNNHSDYCPESLHEVSKDGEIVEIEKECEPYSDNDIEILEEFVAHKIKVEGQTISNLNLKSSESFATNKMSLRKRKRKTHYSSFYGNNNHSNNCPESLHEVSKNGELLKIEKECESYSDNDIEISEEFVARKIKVEPQKILERRNGRYRKLDFISKSSTNKKLRKEDHKVVVSHKKHGFEENCYFSVKEKHLLEKLERRLHQIAKIIKDKRYSEMRKQKALILLKEMSPILEKAETFCNKFQMHSQNCNNFSSGTFIPFKLKELQLLYSNLMTEMHNSLKLRKRNSNDFSFSKYCVRSVGSEEQKKQSKFVSDSKVYEKTNDINFLSSKNSRETAKDLESSRQVNCDALAIKRKINNESVQTHVSDELNLNLRNKPVHHASFHTLINRKKVNIPTWKDRRSENIAYITEKESDTFEKENFLRNAINNCDSTVTLNDSVSFSNKNQSFASLDTHFNKTAADKRREITKDVVGKQSDLVQTNSSVVLKFCQGTDAHVHSASILQDHVTKKEYCNQKLTITEVRNNVNNNLKNRPDDESNMTVDEIPNSLDETQSLVGLDKDLEMIPFEKENEDSCTEFLTQDSGDKISKTASVALNINTVKEYDSVSLKQTSNTGKEKGEQKIISTSDLNSLNARKQNTPVPLFSGINLSNIEKTVISNPLENKIDKTNQNSKAIKSYESNESNTMKRLLQDSSNRKFQISRKIFNALPNNKENPNVVFNCVKSQNFQSNNTTIKSVNSKPVKVDITKAKEKNNYLFKKEFIMAIKNMNRKRSPKELHKYCNPKNLVDTGNQSMSSRDTGKVSATSINNISNSPISNSLQQNINFKDSNSNVYIKPIPIEMNFCNNLNHSTPLKNPQDIQILNGDRTNVITTAKMHMLSNDCVHHSLSDNISDFKSNCNTSNTIIPSPDITNSCNNNINHDTPQKNLQDVPTSIGNKLKKSTIATLQLSIDEIRRGFKTQRATKRKTKVPLIELIQHNLLQPGENVLSVHTSEKIVFGSLDSNGKIISDSKIYSCPLQWYYNITNFCKSAPKTRKSRPCYDKIYYQGRILSHFVDIYHQGLENRNASQGVEESSVTLSSSTGFEVIQRSTAPQRNSVTSTGTLISRPNVLNLLKMKLLLIEDNEVGHMSETVQWDDIDKWD